MGVIRPTLLAAACAVLASTGAALADGMRGSLKDTYVPVPSVFRWTGLYGGVHAGWLRSRNEVTDINLLQADADPSPSYSDGSFTGGLHGGYNWQFNSLVLGLEGDLSFSKAEKLFSLDTQTQDDITGTKLSTYGTLRGRVGVAFDRLLVYGTGGWAWARLRNQSIDTDAGVVDPTQSVSEEKTKSGWVLGGGLEYALTGNLIARIEGLHMDFRDTNLVTPDGNSFQFKNEVDVVRAGLSFKF